LAGKYSAEELAQRLVSVISAGRQVTGDDRIGVTADEARRLLSGGGPRGRSEASDDRGRFGGGGGGRKGGFRVNRGSRGFNDQPKRWGSERGSKPSGKWPNKNTSQSRERAHFSS
jgi:hypothetical protein